jgi:hypothetical protein
MIVQITRQWTIRARATERTRFNEQHTFVHWPFRLFLEYRNRAVLLFLSIRRYLNQQQIDVYICILIYKHIRRSHLPSLLIIVGRSAARSDSSSSLSSTSIVPNDYTWYFQNHTIHSSYEFIGTYPMYGFLSHKICNSHSLDQISRSDIARRK